MTISPRLRIVLAVAIAALLIAAAVWAVGRSRGEAAAEADRERPVPTPQRVFSDGGQTILRIDAATLARSGIATTPLATSDGATTIPIFASVLDMTRLTDLVNGWAVANAQLAAAEARARASQASANRTRLLYADDQNASLAQLQAAQATYAADRAVANAARAQSHTALASARLEFGSALSPGSALAAAIVARRTMLLQIALPALLRNAPRTIAVEADGGIRAVARYIGPAARADPRVPGRGAYYAVPASSGLVPGMNVTAQLVAGGEGGGAVVPAAAIVSWQGQDWIYRRRPDGAFVRVSIATDRRDPAGNAIVANPPPGTPVATRGAQLLLSEELRAQAPAQGDGD